MVAEFIMTRIPIGKAYEVALQIMAQTVYYNKKAGNGSLGTGTGKGGIYHIRQAQTKCVQQIFANKKGASGRVYL